jgi:hypothetical protein
MYSSYSPEDFHQEDNDIFGEIFDDFVVVGMSFWSK